MKLREAIDTAEEKFVRWWEDYSRKYWRSAQLPILIKVETVNKEMKISRKKLLKLITTSSKIVAELKKFKQNQEL